MSDGGVPLDLESFISLLEGLLTINYSAFASFTFVVWDTCITLDQEIEYIWSQSPTSPLKWLFLFNRYFAIGIQLIFLLNYNGVLKILGHGINVCRLRFTLQSLAIQALTASAEAMLMMRVYALYNRSRMMGIILAAVFGGELLSIIPVYAIAIPQMTFSIICSPLPSQPTSLFFGYIVAIALIVQTILLLLTLKPTLAAVRAGWGRTPIIVTLIRDGSWSFFLQFAMVLLNTIFNNALGPFRGSTVAVWQMTFLSFASCRLALNLYGLGGGTAPIGETYQLSTNIEQPGDLYELNSRCDVADDQVASSTNHSPSSISQTLVSRLSPRPNGRGP